MHHRRSSEERLTRSRRTGGLRRRTPRLNADVRRPMLLDAAFSVFVERGFDGASMDAIARRAGVTKPVIYDSFAGKDELFTAVLEREEQRILAEISAAIPSRVDDLETSLADGLTAFFRSVVASPNSYRVVFLGEGGSNAVIARRIHTGRTQVVRRLQIVMTRWLRARRVRDRDAELLAFTLVGAAEGAARALLTGRSPRTPEAAGRALARLVVRGCEA